MCGRVPVSGGETSEATEGLALPERSDLGEGAATPVAPSGEGADVAAIGGSPVDAALVRQAIGGAEKAFEALVRRHLRAAHGVAVSLVGNAEDAEDVCQDAFVAALQRIRECRHPERFRAWLLAIVRNRAHNVRERRAVHDAFPLDPDTAAAAENPGRDAQRAELRGHLKAALDTLTELQREVIVLHDLEGWRHAEIAAELGISAGASRFHLHVARRAMRARLCGLYGQESIR